MAAAAKEATGMDTADLKKHFKLARRKVMHLAIAMEDGAPVLVLDKIKKGRSLVTEIKKDGPATKDHRFGTVVINPENKKLAVFTINKPIGGLSRKLVKALKGTGVSKVSLQFEDGSAAEIIESEEEEIEEFDDDDDLEDQHNAAARPPEPAPAAEHGAGGETPAPAGQSASGDPPAAGGQKAAQGGAGQGEAAKLTADLKELVKRMLAVIAADPSQKSALAELATDAQASIKRGDFAQAAAGIEILRDALDDAGSGDDAGAGKRPAPVKADTGQRPEVSAATASSTTTQAQTSATPASATAPIPAKGGAARVDPAAHAPVIEKARTAWVATRQKIQGDVGHLHANVSTAFKGHEKEAEIVQALQQKIHGMFDKFDDGLEHILHGVNNAKDHEQRDKLVQQAHAMLQKYEQHIAADPAIAAVDKNPFVPMAIKKTMSATLGALMKSIR